MSTSYGSYTAIDSSGISNFTALQAILKEYYGPQQVKNLVYRRNKWLAMLHKEEDWSGITVPIPVIYGNPQGGSATWSSANTNVSGSSMIRFIMGWTQDYELVKITNLVNLATRNDAGAFLKAVQNEMNGGLRTAENRLAGSLFRSSTGTIGTGTIASGGVITLTDTMNITQFEKNMVLEASATDGGAGLGSTSLGYVISVNRSSNTLVVSATAGGSGGIPASWTGTMYFRATGDNNLKINGLSDWLPTTAPTTGDSFNNVDRSVDPSRLAGVRYNGSSQSIEEACVDASALVAREDGNPELAITNHFTYAALAKSLGAKVNYVNFRHDEIPGVGFQGIRIHGADAEINIFADRNCQSQRLYLIDPDTWTLGSMKACPHIQTELDGLTELRDPNGDNTVVRIAQYPILASNAPGHNSIVQTQI